MHSGHLSESRLHFDVECGRNTTLHKAAASGELLEILRLQNLSVRVKSTTEDGHTPLHQSADGGHTEAVKFLLHKGASVNAQDNKQQTPLHWSVMGHSKDVVKVLIKNGACINAADIFGKTPLHISAHEGLENITEYLLKYGALLDNRDKEGQTPLHLAARQGHFKVTKILLANGASANIKDNYGCTPEKLARCCGHVDLAGVIRRRRISRSSDDLDSVQERDVLEQVGEEPHHLYQPFIRGRMGNSRRASINTENSTRMSLREAASRLSSSTSSLSMSPQPKSSHPIKISPSNRQTIPKTSQLMAFSKMQTPRETTSTTSFQPNSSSVSKIQTSKTATETKETGLTLETEKMPLRRAETKKVQVHKDEKVKTSHNTSRMYSTLSGTLGTEETSFTRSGKGKSSSMTSEKNKTSSSSGTSEKNKASSCTSNRDGTSAASSSTPENNNVPSGKSKRDDTASTTSARRKTSSKTSDKYETSSSIQEMSKTPFNTSTVTEMNKIVGTPGTSAPSMSYSQSERDKISSPMSVIDTTSSQTSGNNNISSSRSKISNMSHNTSRRDKILFGERETSKTSSNMTQQKKTSMTSLLESNSLDVVQQDRESDSTSRTDDMLPNTSKSQEKRSRTSQDSRCTSMPHPIQISSLLSKKGDNLDTTDDEYKTLSIQDRIRQFEQLTTSQFQTVISPVLFVKLKRNEGVPPTSTNHDDLNPHTTTRMPKCTSQITERRFSHSSESATAPKPQNSLPSASESQCLQTANTATLQKSRPGIPNAPTFVTAQPTIHVPSSSSKPNKQIVVPGELNLNKGTSSSSAQCGRLSTHQPSASNTADLKQKASKSLTGGAGQTIDSRPSTRTATTTKEINSTTASKISPFRSNEEFNGIPGNVRDRIRIFQPLHKNSTTEPSPLVNKLPLNTSASRTPKETTPRPQMSTDTGQHNYLQEALAPLGEIVTALNQQENGRNNVILVQVSPTFYGPKTTFNVETADNVVNKGTMKIVRDSRDE